MKTSNEGILEIIFNQLINPSNLPPINSTVFDIYLEQTKDRFEKLLTDEEKE